MMFHEMSINFHEKADIAYNVQARRCLRRTSTVF